MKPGDHRHRGARSLAAGLALLTALTLAGLSTTRSTAAFGDSTASSGNSFAADTLHPATSLTAVQSTGDVSLAWTATPDLWATGYNLYRGTTLGGPYGLHAVVAGAATNSHLDTGAAGPPSVQSTATAVQGPGSGLGITVNVPTGTVDGDLLVAIVSIDNSEDTLPITAPAGWTQIFQHGQTGGGQSALGVWWRIASSEPSSYSFSWTPAEEAFGAILRVVGAHLAAPIHVWGYSGVINDASPTAPSVTTTVDNTLVLRIVSLDGNDHVEPSPLSSLHPAGTTGRFELITSPAPDPGGTFGGAADEAQTSAGATGTAVFTITASEGWIAATVAIRPAVYHYRLETYAGNWTSALSNEASCC